MLASVKANTGFLTFAAQFLPTWPSLWLKVAKTEIVRLRASKKLVYACEVKSISVNLMLKSMLIQPKGGAVFFWGAALVAFFTTDLGESHIFTMIKGVGHVFY